MEYLSGSWQYWKDLRGLPSASLSLSQVGVAWDVENYFLRSATKKWLGYTGIMVEIAIELTYM
jgi:hypothetical protein